MTVRAVDDNNDWLFGKGRNDYKSRNSAIAQCIKTRLQSFLGDCFFATEEGIDWFNLLGGKNQLALELAVRATILNTPLVTRLLSSSVELDRETRLITLSYAVETVYTGLTEAEIISTITSFALTEDGRLITTEDGDILVWG